MRKKVTFISQGNELSGLLELPDEDCYAYALFAHCFTCGKDIGAATKIARGLVQEGIAVLRFDFTGLGNSDGDFANTNFSSNVEDLVAAAEFLKQEYQAPKLLIGHSLGGAAVLMASHQLDDVKAVVTIGAPSNANHVTDNFKDDLEKIEQEGKATVKLGLREFTIKKQFLDDIKSYQDTIKPSPKKALLIMHSPMDEIVPIEEAEKIYHAAKHPKSFISLDKANHLLSNKEDIDYVSRVLAAWSSKYIVQEVKAQQNNIAKGHVQVAEKDHRFTQQIMTDSHLWLADEPKEIGGQNLGPDPYEHLLAALGACTSMTLRMYANRKKWPVEHISVALSHQKIHGKDCEDYVNSSSTLDVIDRELTIKGNKLTEEQRNRLIEIADLCPVHKTLEQGVKTQTVISIADDFIS